MAVIFTNEVGKPFSSAVITALNSRQDAETIDNYGQFYEGAYFTLERTDSIPKDGVTPKVIGGSFASMTSDPSEYWTYITTGALAVENPPKPLFTKVDISVEDYAFYIVSADFVISNLADFEGFRKMWLGFGNPVKITIGKKQTVAQEGADNVDSIVLYGATVKFDYTYVKDAGGSPIITGKITMYSISALMAVDSTNEITSSLMDNLKSLVIKEFTTIAKTGTENEYYACLTRSTIENKQKTKGQSPTTFGAILPTSSPVSINTLHTSYNSNYFVEDIPDNIESSYINSIIDDKGGTALKLLLSYYKLDNTIFGTDVYFYVSMRIISVIINYYFKEFEKKDYIVNVHDAKIRTLNDAPFSVNPDNLIINPLSKQTDKVNLSDVYVSALFVYKILSESKSAFDFIEKLIEQINSDSNGIIRLRKIQYANNTSGSSQNISYFDENSLNTLPSSNSFFVLDPTKRYSSIDNINIVTEVDGAISDYTFFKTNSRVTNSLNVIYDDKNNNKQPVKLSFTAFGGFTFNVTDKYSEGRFKDIIIQNISTVESMIGGDIPSKTKTLLASIYLFVKSYPELYLELVKLKNSNIDGSGYSVKIPLKVSFRVPGLGGIKIGQTFKVASKSLPVSFNLNDKTDDTIYLVNTINHELNYVNVDTSWYTTVSGIMYVPSVIPESLQSEIKTANTDAEKILKEIIRTYEADADYVVRTS